jgi:hypothetical protein
MANYIHTLNKKLDHPAEKCLVEVTLEIHSLTFNLCTAAPSDKKYCVQLYRSGSLLAQSSDFHSSKEAVPLHFALTRQYLFTINGQKLLKKKCVKVGLSQGNTVLASADIDMSSELNN